MEYFSSKSENTDMKSSSYVNAYIFNDHIEGTGVSYRRNFKTISELEEEIANLEIDFKNEKVSQSEYDMRLEELHRQISARRQIHKPRTIKSKNRIDNMQSLRRSQKRLLLYAYGNFDVPFCLMATLTYKVKVYNMEITVDDFKEFRAKFRKMFPNAVWLAVFEFCEDGSTHIHFVFKNARGATHDVLTEMWGHGMAYVTRFDPERIPYFCKERRLERYPTGCKLYSKSRNCKLPKRIRLSVEKFENLTKNMECVQSTATTLYVKDDVNVASRPVNHYIYKKYKRKKEN